MRSLRIAIGQFAHETSTFSEVKTTIDTFKQAEWTSGDELIDKHQNVRDYLGGMIQKGRALGVELVPTFSARCNPSGLVTKETFETIRDELISRIKAAGKLDAICLALHGAGVAEGYIDLEGELLKAVRQEVGYEIPITVSLDLHGNITELMVEEADGLFGVHEYPHVDSYEAGEKAMEMAVKMAKNEIKPVIVMEKLPLLMFPNTTFKSPAKDIKLYCEEKEKQSGVLDCTFFHGFARADTENTGACIIVITDDQPELAEEIAKDVARKVWNIRESFIQKYYSPEEAVEQALAREGMPIVINETSDNPGSGAPGDGTYLLRALLEKNAPKTAFGFIRDPEVAEIAHKAGVGATIEVELGGKTDSRHGDPIPVKAYVKALTDGKFIQSSPMGQGAKIDYGKSARLQIGNVDVIVSCGKSQTLDKEIFQLHGIDIREYKIIALKSCQHFRAGFEPYAKEIMTSDSPGISTSNPAYYDYKHIPRPIFPVDPDATY